MQSSGRLSSGKTARRTRRRISWRSGLRSGTCFSPVLLVPKHLVRMPFFSLPLPSTDLGILTDSQGTTSNRESRPFPHPKTVTPSPSSLWTSWTTKSSKKTSTFLPWRPQSSASASNPWSNKPSKPTSRYMDTSRRRHPRRSFPTAPAGATASQ